MGHDPSMANARFDVWIGRRQDIYRPGAVHCIRSLSVMQRMALAAQQCCYDGRRRLVTRGWAAGTPALVSPEASLHLSRVTERLPWLACKGDFSRYHSPSSTSSSIDWWLPFRSRMEGGGSRPTCIRDSYDI